MKKFLTILIFLLVSTSVFCVDNKSIENRVYHDYLIETLPNRFAEPFYEHTKSNIQTGLEMLAIGKQESSWKYFVGLKNNTNGTTDHGPLGLNSSHFSEFWFQNVIKKFAKNYWDDSDVCYMIGGIYYYKDLRSKVGTYTAYRQYNGGPTYASKPATIDYANSVAKYERDFVIAYENYKKQNWARVSLELELRETLLAKN